MKVQKFVPKPLQSTTDPEARLRVKAASQEATLFFGLHTMMKNRRGLYVDY